MIDLQTASGKSLIIYSDKPAKSYAVFFGLETHRSSKYFLDFKSAMDFAKKQESETHINIIPSEWSP